MRAPVFLAAMAAASLTSGCAATAIGAAAGFYAAQDRTIGQGIDDSTGVASIKTRMLSADARAFLRVDVEMSNGQALLSGVVPTEEHRVAAERIAWEVPSVEAVANELEVGSRRGVLRSVQDEWIAVQVRNAFLADARVKGVNFNVEVFKGVVYILGRARNDEELKVSAEHASLVPGVERVVSYAWVLPTGNPIGRDQAAYGQPDAGAPSGQGGLSAAELAFEPPPRVAENPY